MDVVNAPEMGMAIWADMASVRRTIEWVGLDDTRLETAQYTGVNVTRLLSKIEKQEGLQPEIVATVRSLLDLMEFFDESDLVQRQQIIVRARELLDGVVSIGELGARRHDLEKRVKLSKPEGRDRRSRNKGEKPTPPAEVESPDNPVAESKTETAPDAEVDTKPLVADDQAEPDAPAEVEAPRSLVEEFGLPETSPPLRESRPPRRLEWGHEGGTGASVDVLGATQDVVDALEQCGILTVGDLLQQPPAGHICFRQTRMEAPGGKNEVDIDDVLAPIEVEPIMVRGRLVRRVVRLTANGSRHEVMLQLRGAGILRCTWVAGEPRGWHRWKTTMELAFIGRPEESDDGWSMFEAEPVGMDGRGSGWLPEYAIDSVDDRTMRELVGRALVRTMSALRDPLPRRVTEHWRLIDLDDALRDAHFPSNKAGKGRGRLAFEELLLLQLGIGWRAKSRSRERGIAHRVLHGLIGDIGAQQQVSLSDSQEAAFSEVRRDLRSSHAMVRLLQGEVGTDKPTIAFLAASVVMENKAQVVYILPDAAAAERRFLFSESMFRSVGYAPLLISDKPNRGQLDAIGRGECHIVFGTKKLLEKDVKWKKLGLVVVEERDAYGTVDPAQLASQGASPDLLVITETPIPDSLTLTVFGEYQVSTVSNETPVRCTAQVYAQNERQEAYEIVKDALDDGRQAYVCFPIGEDGDLLGADDALRYASALQSKELEGARIGVYCSDMSRDDRLRVFEDFQARRLDVLVATTYVEEAPVVSNASVVVVEHADHHDLSRLHCLRGHVGQGFDAGQCLLVMSEKPSVEARERLEKLCAERDGFRIAEMDLKERGWGAMLGDGAKDAPEFRWVDPVLDHSRLLGARDEAFRMVKNDPGMRRNHETARAVKERWGAWLGEAFVASVQGDSPKGDSRGNKRRRGRRRRRKN